MPELPEIRSVKRQVQEELLARKGVVGVAIGYKYVAGTRTDEVSIQVFVEEKKDVSGKERIPKTVDGVKTDVLERKIVPHQRAVQLAALETQADTGTYNTLKGGVSIGPCRTVGSCAFVGTLGTIVTDNANGTPLMLSNFHVMCVDSNWTVGDTLAQPGRVDGSSCPSAVAGRLQRAVIGGQVDGAVATIEGRSHICEIADIGAVTGTNTATLGMKVRKRGRTTGLTYGTVDSIDLAVNVPYDDADCGVSGVGTVAFTGQIGIVADSGQNPQFGIGGDSGSVVVDEGRKVIGLYFAGTQAGDFGVANPIQAVLDALNVRLCVPASKSPIKELKDGKPELKELKREKFEHKELKLEKFEKLEKVEKLEKYEKPEFKEFKGEKREDLEGVTKNWQAEVPIPKPTREDFTLDPTQPIERPVADYGSLEERVARLEALLMQQPHFIAQSLRPDLRTGALKNEQDYKGSLKQETEG